MTTVVGAAEAAITVAGRTFRPVTRSTFAHQLYLMPLIRDAGLLGVAGKVKGAASEDDAEAMLFRLIESPHTLALLSGVLVEEGKTWNAEDAEQNQTFFAEVSDPMECAALQRVLLGLVTDFFAVASSSLATSGSSSAPSGADLPASESSTPIPTEETTPSASGGTSSAPSPATRRVSRKSSTGRSGKG